MSTTATVLRLCSRAAAKGESRPNAPATTPTPLIPRLEAEVLAHQVHRASGKRDHFRHVADVVGASAMSAASSAMSAPPWPIATPTSAAASAGASLMPSPTRATSRLALQAPHQRELVIRHRLGDYLRRMDAQLIGHEEGRLSTVAGDHVDFGYTRPRSAAQGRGCFRSHHVCHADQADHPPGRRCSSVPACGDRRERTDVGYQRRPLRRPPRTGVSPPD